MVVMILTGLFVAREREFGTFDQLLVAPFIPREILIGKFLPGMFFGLLDALLFSLGAVFWFHVPFHGTIPALFLAFSCFICTMVGTGASGLFPVHNHAAGSARISRLHDARGHPGRLHLAHREHACLAADRDPLQSGPLHHCGPAQDLSGRCGCDNDPAPDLAAVDHGCCYSACGRVSTGLNKSGFSPHKDKQTSIYGQSWLRPQPK